MVAAAMAVFPRFPPPRWLARLLPPPRYQIGDCRPSGRVGMEVRLSADGGDRRYPFSVRLSPTGSGVDISLGEEPPRDSIPGVLALDIRRRFAKCPADCVFDFLATIAAADRRSSADSVWAALGSFEDGRVPDALAIGSVVGAIGPETPIHHAALGFLIAVSAGDQRRRADAWWRLITDERVDARIVETLARVGDGNGDRLRRAAGAVLRWGVPDERTRSAYGFPASPSTLAADSFAPFADRMPERIAHFGQQGYIVLRGLLDPELVRAWARRVGACFRREGPQRAPDLASTEFGRTLDPDAPNPSAEGTVQWSAGMTPIHLLSMELAATVDALVGGQERLKPLVSDHLHFSQVLERWETSGPGWHLDETPSKGRIDNQYLALVGLVLLTDVEEADGPTAFLADSPHRIARALVEKGGCDQDDRTWTQAIAARCEREVLATGRAGDVYLAHPLTLHRRASVQRRCFRIISNPNFMSSEPLRYLEPQTPVERYGASALS